VVVYVLLAVVLAAIVLYALFLVWFYVNHDRIALPGEQTRAQTVTDVGPSVEDLRLPVTDTTTVHAWWIPAPRDADTLIFFHGNGYALESAAKSEALVLRQTGMNLLLMDYRGYGTSSPLRTTAATTEADALAGLAYLTAQRGIPSSRIWISGRSIGSAVATSLATQAPGCAGLILITPLTNTVDIKPVKLILRPLTWLGLTEDFDSLRRIATLRMPVLLLAGTNDTLTPPAMARHLYDRAPGPKHIEIIDGAGHNDFWESAGTQAVAAITRMVRPTA
jgi:uncharacterized protein